MAECFVAGVGAANVDLHGRSLAPILLRDSNPGHLRTSAGGVTRNILENLARMGGACKLFSAVGGDIFGEYILAESARAGMDVSHVLRCPGQPSSGYLALIDASGDMFAAMSDMRVLENVTPEFLEQNRKYLEKAAAVVCDPCLTPAALEWLTAGRLGATPLFADPVSTAYARRLRPYAGRFFCLKPNALELAALTDEEIGSDADLERAAARLLEAGTNRVVVSLGRRGCYWADRAGNRFFSALRPVERMTDATGAGDAFMAGLLYGHLRNMLPREAARWALAAGIVAVTSDGTVSPGMDGALIQKILEENQ